MPLSLRPPTPPLASSPTCQEKCLKTATSPKTFPSGNTRYMYAQARSATLGARLRGSATIYASKRGSWKGVLRKSLQNILRRVLRRCLVVSFNLKEEGFLEGFKKGVLSRVLRKGFSEGGFGKVLLCPFGEYEPFRRLPYHCLLFWHCVCSCIQTSIGACAMTTKFLDNKICTFKILLSWLF